MSGTGALQNHCTPAIETTSYICPLSKRQICSYHMQHIVQEIWTRPGSGQAAVAARHWNRLCLTPSGARLVAALWQRHSLPPCAHVLRHGSTKIDMYGSLLGVSDQTTATSPLCQLWVYAATSPLCPGCMPLVGRCCRKHRPDPASVTFGPLLQWPRQCARAAPSIRATCHRHRRAAAGGGRTCSTPGVLRERTHRLQSHHRARLERGLQPSLHFRDNSARNMPYMQSATGAASGPSIPKFLTGMCLSGTTPAWSGRVENAHGMRHVY